jgi:SpoVK/Ycf46/Vps4 family AAA+-type ATPase
MFLRKSEHHGDTATLACFSDNGTHLRAEFDWLHQLVRAELGRADRRAGRPAADEFTGLYISREEIDRYIEAPCSFAVEAPDDSFRETRARIASERRMLDRRIELSIAAGADLRLERLTRTFELDEVTRGVLVCCAGAELDGQISRLFAYLQNDAAKRRPTFAMLARLLSPDASDPITVRSLFGQTCALHAHRLLERPAETPDSPFPTMEARLAPGVIDFLIGNDRLLPSLAEVAEVVKATAVIEDLAYYRQHRNFVEQLLRLRHPEGRLPVCYIGGPRGAGDRLIAESLANALGKNLVLVQGARLPGDAGKIEEFSRMLGREARLRDCIMLIQDADEALPDADHETAKAIPFEAFLRALGDCEVIISGAAPAARIRHRMRTKPFSFELTYPTIIERSEIWERSLRPRAATRLALDIQVLAAKFHFTPGQIARVIANAQTVAPRDAAGDPLITGTELHARCREEAESGLDQFCQRIIARHSWDDIVLPADARLQLQEVCRWVKHRSQVYESWGFGAKLARGKGLAVLLSGASGTGKTMSAEVIARDLQLDLFRVVSKYIGETERNLSRIFSKTSSGNCLLFFDEADALFGKRTEVKDAHDRYANIEINYLLAEMDSYEGLIIVATNMKGNLDQAFIRRFSHVIEYPLPDERLREVIWRKSFPKQTPLGSDVDFGFLAQRFNVPGGSIRNIALSSAFLASADGQTITMEHVILATKREYQKIGRVCSKSDYGQYYALIRETELA